MKGSSLLVRGSGVVSSDISVVVGPGITSLLTAERPCIASITVWTIVQKFLKVKGASVGVKEAMKATLVIDVFHLFSNCADRNKGESTTEGEVASDGSR